MSKVICGIQQVGVGVSNFNEAWEWYRSHFGMDIRVFEEEAVADLMLPYTDGNPMNRHAALAMNMHGGGGFEIWQHKDITARAASEPLTLGDYGIFCAKMKTLNAEATYEAFKRNGVKILGELSTNPAGIAHFFVEDPYNNLFEFVEDSNIYKQHKGPNSTNGGCYGAIIGVSDFDHAKALYCNVLGYDEIVYDQEGVFDDLSAIPGGEGRVRRVLLRHTARRMGPFSNLLGPSQMELVTALEGSPKKIFEQRLWGELGFIHLCFDVREMDALKQECADAGFPFTVDSADSFDMGVAAGHFAYVEDPDGTLIEFVETHKLPILKKIGWYMNLQKRNPRKALPNWMVNTLEFGRVKQGELM